MLFDLFKETIFVKKTSELELKYNVLKELQSLYPNKEELTEELIKFRKSRSQEMKIQAYYIFTNDELEKNVEEEPKNIENLKGILSPIKIKTHGELIIELINSL